MKMDQTKKRMREIFNKYQPIVLVMEDVNPDEYDPEIDMIANKIHSCKKLEDVHDLVYTTFTQMFGKSDAGSKEKYFKISKELYSKICKNQK